jgi:hypothetical protein
MGIMLNDVRFLVNARAEGVSFARTLTLGRLNWYVRPGSLARWAERTGHDLTGLEVDRLTGAYGEPFLHWLGATQVDSMDVSAYEGATVLHDLNQPVPAHLKGAYSVVFDGGTLEHIFNFPQAVRNCMEMTAVGGHLLLCSPANNEMGHGFYQFSPELWYRVLSPENGFTVERMLMYAQVHEHEGDELFEVADPLAMGERVVLINHHPTYLLIQARRTADVPLFTRTPQQSDYATAWNVAGGEGQAPAPAGLAARLYRGLVPKRVRDPLYALRMRLRPRIHGDLGALDARHFKRFEPK